MDTFIMCFRYRRSAKLKIPPSIPCDRVNLNIHGQEIRLERSRFRTRDTFYGHREKIMLCN